MPRSSSSSLRWMERALGLARALDRADLPFFRLLPAPLKRDLTWRFLVLLARLHRGPIRVNGFTIQVPPEALKMYRSGSREPWIGALIRRHLRPGMVAVDVGANVGVHTLEMARAVGPQGRVYAVEPHPVNLRFLRRNLARHGADNVEVIPAAAGRETTTASLLVAREAGHHRLSHSGLATSSREAVGSVEIPVIALDQAIAGEVDFVKIDVEGGELDVLYGMDRLLSRPGPQHVVVEWTPTWLEERGHDPLALPAFLEKRGFRVKILRPSTGTIPDTDLAQIPARIRTGSLPPLWQTDLYGYKEG